MDHIKNRPTFDAPPRKKEVIEAILPEPNMLEQMSPWQTNFHQIEPGAMQTRVKARSGRLLSLLEISMNRSVHQQGSAPPDTLTFGFSLSDGDFRWRGAEMKKENFLTFGGKDGFEGLTDRAFHGVTFSVANTDLEILAERLGLPIDDRLRSSGIFDPAQGPDDIQCLTEKALKYLKSDGQIAMDVNDEEDMLATFLHLAADTSHHKDRCTGHDRTRAVRLALEFMEENAEHNIPISRICEAANVSLRTLHRAFHEVCGIGPKAYFLRMRLGLLRRALLNQDRIGGVSDAANQLGFWHMGQLARDYRAQYGELPSQTTGGYRLETVAHGS